MGVWTASFLIFRIFGRMRRWRRLGVSWTECRAGLMTLMSIELCALSIYSDSLQSSSSYLFAFFSFFHRHGGSAHR